METTNVKTLFLLDDGIDRTAIGPELTSGTSLQTVDVLEGFEESRRALGEMPADLVVVVADGNSERMLHLVAGSTKQQPDRPVVVLALGGPNGMLGSIFAAGADDVVALPDTAERIRFVLEKAVARKRGVVVPEKQSPMICLLGPKGGTGKTLTACNLTVAFALAGLRPALVDLDLQFGDVGIALGLSPDRTIYDLVRTGGTIDGDKVEGFLSVHSSGARVLIAPTRPDQAGLIGVEFVRDVLTALRSTSDVVIVDTPPAFSPEVIAAVDAASHLCMVGALDALSLKDSKLGLETLELMGHRGPKVKFVLNRDGRGGGISHADAKAILDRTPDAYVPEEKEIVRGVTEGRPIVLLNERSKASRAFRDLARTYRDEFEAQAAPPDTVRTPTRAPRRGLVAALLGRSA